MYVCRVLSTEDLSFDLGLVKREEYVGYLEPLGHGGPQGTPVPLFGPAPSFVSAGDRYPVPDYP